MIWIGSLIAAICAVLVRARLRERAACRMFPPDGQMIRVGEAQIHAHVLGKGPDVVLIHGASGSTRDFSFGLAKSLARKYRVIMLDRPGHGHSPRPHRRFLQPWNTQGESLALQADLLAGAAAKLGAKRPIIVGHSYGGAVALAWATQRPAQIAGLVLLGAVSNPWPGLISWLYRLNSGRLGGLVIVPLLTALVPASYLRRSIEEVFRPNASPAGYAGYFGARLSLRRSAMRANAQQVNSLRPQIAAMAPHYSELTCPAEIIHGDQDTSVPLFVHSALLVQQLPNARLTVLDGTGHMPHHIHPRHVLDAIDRVRLASDQSNTI